MNVEQLSTQIVAINDAIQILARSGTMVESHTKEIDGLLQKHASNEERIRDIESLIHQSCELKTKELNEHGKEVDEKINRVYDKAFQYAWQFSGAVAAVTIGFFYYTFTTIETKTAEHIDFESRQEAKSDKVFSEIFTVMRDIKKDLSAMKADMAVVKNNQSHYQTVLQNHMEDEDKKWRNLK